MKRRNWKFGTLVAAMAVLGGALADNAAAEPTRKIGDSWEYELPGNPSTGYIWQVDPAYSEDLQTVSVEALGYRSNEGAGALVGAPAQFVFKITCAAAGSAHLYMTYVGPDKETVGAVRENWVNCQ